MHFEVVLTYKGSAASFYLYCRSMEENVIDVALM